MMNTDKKNAICELADDLYMIECDTNKAHFILNELCERFFEEGYDGSIEAAQHIALRYEWAQKCANILLDYIASVRKALSDMSAIANESENT